MKNKGYAKLGGGAIRCIMGDVQVPYGLWAPAGRKTKKGNDGGLHKLSQGKEKIE